MVRVALKSALTLLIGIWLASSVACLSFIAIGTDEAWVLNGLRSSQEPTVPGLSTEVILTSGGPFALANLFLERSFGSVVWIHRSFSLACLWALAAYVFRIGAKAGRSWVAGGLAVALLLGLPGTAEVGTLALGNSAACLLMVLGASIWTRVEAPGLVRTVVAGLFFGFAAACRTEMTLTFAAVIAVGAIRPLEAGGFSWRLPLRGTAMALLALGIFLGSLYLLRRASPTMPLEDQLTNTANSSGLSGGMLASLLDYPRFLNKLLVGQSFEPFAILALASALPFCFRSTDPGENRLSAVLVASGWMIALGWLFRSPIPHLRYLWPALACIAIPAGLTVARIYARMASDGRSPAAFLCLIVAIGSLVGGLSGTGRSLVLGEGDVISWEWSREMGADYFRRFQARRDQADVVQYLKDEIPADGQIYSTVPYKLRYLTHRPIIDLTRPRSVKAGPAGRTGSDGPPASKYVVIPPEVGTYLYLTPEADAWYRSHAKLMKQFGRYSVYRLDRDWPEDAELIQFYRTNYLRHPLSDRWFGR